MSYIFIRFEPSTDLLERLLNLDLVLPKRNLKGSLETLDRQYLNKFQCFNAHEV